MMFAKNPSVRAQLQEAWESAVQERIYVAVVEGALEPSQGTVVSWLTENKALVMKSSPTPNDGLKAITHYRVLQSNRRLSLVELSLETGRKNQIRAHMQDLGNPVLGDSKYGARQNPIHRMALHARVLAFRHPVTSEEKRFETPIPEEFRRLFANANNKLK